MLPRRVTIPLAILVGILLWRRAMRPKEYVDVVYEDASLLRLERGVEADDLLDDARELLELRADRRRAALGAPQHALLEGDFLLRSGRRSSHCFDKYRFETRPELLEAIQARVSAVVGEHEPAAVRLAGPELGAVALAAASSLASRLPFLIVRKEPRTTRPPTASRVPSRRASGCASSRTS